MDMHETDLEEALMQQLLSTPALMEIVDEVFWEHAVRGSPMQARPEEGPARRGFWRGPGGGPGSRRSCRRALPAARAARPARLARRGAHAPE